MRSLVAIAIAIVAMSLTTAVTCPQQKRCETSVVVKQDINRYKQRKDKCIPKVYNKEVKKHFKEESLEEVVKKYGPVER